MLMTGDDVISDYVTNDDVAGVDVEYDDVSGDDINQIYQSAMRLE